MASHPVRAAAIGLALALVGKAAAAQDASCGGRDPVGRLVSALGDVRINGRAPTGALPFVPLCEGDLVTVGVESRATAYLLAADTPFRIDEASAVRLLAPGQPSSGLLDLTRGALYFLSEVRRTLTIRTPYISAGVEGTEVYLRVADAGAELIVLEGAVALTPGARMPADTVLAPASTGDRVVVDARGEAERGVVPGDGPFGALRRVVVGQLSWTLYYPDILPGVEAAADPRLGEAARLLAAGQADAAEALLAGITGAGPEAGLRDALLTTIAVARRDGALAGLLAAQAVERAPDQAAPRLALSYARQLALDLDGALAAAQAAAALAPDSPLPPARVAEIHLMRGETRAARAAARQSVARGGGALAAIVQGYADLAALRGARAEQSFRRALLAESQNPLALLGLGLSQIKQGDLGAGREQIESAVVHDPSSSLLRSYLGKAYFEERRDAPSGKQYEIAKELDPTDPTPWFYDAIRLQLDNRPVEALRNLQRSVSLNDTRLPYRSRLLIEQDAAVRGASLGSIYDDLGFELLGINEVTKSLSRDPASASAHRTLSDLYVGDPKLEVSRASELLQSQLLQEVGRTPLQPSATFIGLNTLQTNGPSQVTFNEFTPLFDQDGVSLWATGAFGSDSTRTDELIGSAQSGPAALSIGQFYYHTNGFRENAGFEHNIYDLLGQFALSEDVTIQAEFRTRDTKQGDVAQVFDPQAFSSETNREIDQDIGRLGIRYTPTPRSTLLGSLFIGKRKEKFNDKFPPSESNVIDFINADLNVESNGYAFESQYLYTGDRANLVVGGGEYEIEDDEFNVLDPQAIPDFPIDFDPEIEDITTDTDQRSAYAYLDVRAPSSIIWTGGVAWDSVDAGSFGKTRIQPKLGVRWQATPYIAFRTVYFETLKRDLLVQQTLEPTQISGFNQLFDDFTGTEAKQLGGAVDLMLGAGMFAGVEATRRNLQVVEFDGGDSEISDAREETYRMWLNWAPVPRLAFGATLLIDDYEAAGTPSGRNEPEKVRTTLLPVRASYFDPSGIFGRLTLTILDQRVDRSDQATIDDGEENALLIDAALGYRLPNYRGIASLEVLNLFNQSVNYQDENFRTNETASSRFIPERTILARVTLVF